MWEEFRHKTASPVFPRKWNCATRPRKCGCGWKGCSRPPKPPALGERLQESLARSKGKLVLDFKKLHWDKVESLEPLREKLAAYRSRIRVVLPKLSSAHPELILLAAMFQATVNY